MAHLIEHRAQVLYISASSVTNDGKRRKIFIESRPEYAVFTLQGVKEKYPISWEHLFEAARRHHAKNLRIEADANKQRQSTKNRPT